MISLLLDEGLPRRASADLRALGWDAWHVVDTELGGASDLKILEAAKLNQRVVVTLDRDFVQILALRGSREPSVIHLRHKAMNRQKVVAILCQILPVASSELEGGAIVSVHPAGYRIRKLPIFPLAQ